MLHKHYPEPVIFPKLHRLRVSETAWEHHFDLFMSPALQAVELTRADHQARTELINTLGLATDVCDIRELYIETHGGEIRFGELSPPVVDILSRVLLRQTRLERVKLPSDISKQAFTHLAHTPSLELLAIDFYGAEYEGILEASSSPTPAIFPRLTELCLKVANMHDVSLGTLLSFLDALTSSSPLRKLTLIFFTPPTDTSKLLSDLFSVISKFASLTHCKLRYSPRSVWDEGTVSPVMLEPLYRIEGILRLELLNIPVHVSPDVLRKMAAAWPQVERIELGQSSETSTSDIGLEDIAPLVDSCPRLEYFGARFLPEARPGWVAPSIVHRQRPMVVDFGDSPFHSQDAPRIAAILARLLPVGSRARVSPSVPYLEGDINQLLSDIRE